MFNGLPREDQEHQSLFSIPLTWRQLDRIEGRQVEWFSVYNANIPKEAVDGGENELIMNLEYYTEMLRDINRYLQN